MIAWMNGKASDIGVIEVEVAERGTIGESRKVCGRASIGADDGCVAGDRKRDIAANADRPFVEGADAAANRIDNVRFNPFNGRQVEILEVQAVRIFGELFGE